MKKKLTGPRQHYLPRSLLKGFASRQDGGQFFTWVQREEGTCFETNILNVAVEGRFYESGHETVDPEIQQFENQFAGTLSKIRNYAASGQIVDDSIVACVVHLTIRTRHLRQSILEASEFLAERVLSFLEDDRNLTAILRRRLQSNPRFIEESLEDHLKEVGFPKPQRRFFLKAIKKIPISEVLAGVPSLVPFMSSMKKILLDAIPAAAKTGHLQALAKDLVPEPRASRYRGLHWYVVRVESDCLLLGDSGPIVDVGQRYKTLPDEDDRLEAVYLPIGAQDLVVGSPKESMPSPLLNAINEASAACARDFVIGPSRKIVEEQAPNIGKWGFILSPDQLERLSEEILSEIME